MSGFTDSDLRRLKREIRANKDYPDNGDLSALIERLEAAEYALSFMAVAHEKNFKPAWEAIQEWKKASGKP